VFLKLYNRHCIHIYTIIITDQYIYLFLFLFCFPTIAARKAESEVEDNTKAIEDNTRPRRSCTAVNKSYHESDTDSANGHNSKDRNKGQNGKPGGRPRTTSSASSERSSDEDAKEKGSKKNVQKKGKRVVYPVESMLYIYI
jgi:hypothetical protein